MDYAERLTVPLRWWVQGTMLVASLWLAVLAATPEVVAWSVSAIALALLVALLVGYGSPQDPTLDADDVRRLAGVDADARAYLLLRPYLKRGVRIDIADPADPAPYWLVSCRRPEEIVTAVRVGRTRSTSG